VLRELCECFCLACMQEGRLIVAAWAIVDVICGKATRAVLRIQNTGQQRQGRRPYFSWREGGLHMQGRCNKRAKTRSKEETGSVGCQRRRQACQPCALHCRSKGVAGTANCHARLQTRIGVKVAPSTSHIPECVRVSTGAHRNRSAGCPTTPQEGEKPNHHQLPWLC
jgi:hypothetical protein